jgi:hypothetical protein
LPDSLQPPSHIPESITSPLTASERSYTLPVDPVEPTPVEDASSIFFDSDPFRCNSLQKENSESSCSETAKQGIPQLCSFHQPSPPSTVTPSLHITIKDGRGLPHTLERFKSLTTTAVRNSLRFRTRRSSVTKHSKQIHHPHPALFVASQSDSPPKVTLGPIPDCTLDLSDFSSILSSQSNPSDVCHLPAVPVVHHLEPSVNHTSDHLPAQHSVNFKCVDPRELTASPSTFTNSTVVDISTRNSFIPPSPSWLSRNVQGPESFDIHSIFARSEISDISSIFYLDCDSKGEGLEHFPPVQASTEDTHSPALFRPPSPPIHPLPHLAITPATPENSVISLLQTDQTSVTPTSLIPSSPIRGRPLTRLPRRQSAPIFRAIIRSPRRSTLERRKRHRSFNARSPTGKATRTANPFPKVRSLY